MQWCKVVCAFGARLSRPLRFMTALGRDTRR